MPIDFNPNFYINIQPQLIKPYFKAQEKLSNDVFIKKVDSNFKDIKIEKKSFGKIEKTGEKATLYTITNNKGSSVSLSSFGATITSIKIPSKNGELVDVTHGYNNVKPYEKSPIGHAGGTIGPYANKISNGIFTINNKKYTLECNKDNGQNHSHGGSEGFDVKNWNAKILKDGIEFSYLKKDMESGYPGNVLATVTYKFDNNNNLYILYNAQSDKDTIINMTNHTYFNLDGAENSQENSVLNHIVKLPNSSKITEINEQGIPTGNFLNIENTPFDFRKEQKIEDVIEIENKQLSYGKGFDHNYIVDGYDGNKIIDVAEIKSKKTGINLKVSTNLPGFQFYTANNLGKINQPAGKDNNKYEKRSGLCIEPQFFPNAINTDSFTEKGLLKSDETYNRCIIYSFSN